MFGQDRMRRRSKTEGAAVVLNAILGSLALLSLALTLWQWTVARRFPLHQRVKEHPLPPAATLLKPLKSCDKATEDCLRSWFEQDYTGRVQILFGVASAEDSACAVVRKLIAEHPASDAQLIICGEPIGANAKVSKLVELERLAKHEILVISDADVRVPADLLTNVVAPLRGLNCGLVTCFYRLANPTTLAMRWEAIGTNADFWSQVLQAQSLKPLDFALGAVMALRRAQLREIGGFKTLTDCLADDYQLGRRLAGGGHRIVISPVVAECWSAPMGWAAVWKHQLRWARTIRVCRPVPYFFSILSNATLWPLLWLLATPSRLSLSLALVCLSVRVATALDLQHRLSRITSRPGGTSRKTHHVSRLHISCWILVPFKDLLQTALWFGAFIGNRIEWRGQRMTLKRDGTLQRA